VSQEGSESKTMTSVDVRISQKCKERSIAEDDASSLDMLADVLQKKPPRGDFT
jgi:hypothetical protein